MSQGQFFKRTLRGLNSKFSFSSCLTKAEEHSLSYYLPIAGGRIIGFIPFPMVLLLPEMQSVSFRIWTRVAVSISYDDNHYTTGKQRKVCIYGKQISFFEKKKIILLIESHNQISFNTADYFFLTNQINESYCSWQDFSRDQFLLVGWLVGCFLCLLSWIFAVLSLNIWITSLYFLNALVEQQSNFKNHFPGWIISMVR